MRDLPRTSKPRQRRDSAHSSCCSASTAPTRRDCCAHTELLSDGAPTCSLCSTTTPARHWRAAPGGGTHERRRHDRRRRRAHARDARRCHVRPAPDGGGPATAVCAWPRCALDRVADVVAVGVTRRGDRVVTVWCPACGKRHVHGWPWDSVEPGARRPHCRFLSPHDYYIPRPARKLLAHLDAGPRSAATTDAAQEPVQPGRG